MAKKAAAAAKKTAAKKTAATKTATTKTSVTKATSAKPTAKKTAAKKTSVTKPASAKKTAAKKTSVTTPTAKKTAAKATAKQTAAKATATRSASELVHCYRLIFQVDPGGSRKAESYVASTLAEAKRAAQDDLASGIGAYHAVYYGEEIFLQCWEGNKKVASIDLHPYIEYRIPGHPGPLRFKQGEDTLLEMDEDDETMEAMCDEQLAIKVKIDWDKIQLPTLKGRPLRDDEVIELERGRSWTRGFHEHWDDKLPT